MENANARNTLRRVAEQLLSMANQGPSNTTTNSNNNSPAAANTSSTGSGSSARNPPLHAALTEHQRIFNYTPRKFVPSNRNQKGKNRVKTCTIKFFCLSCKDDEQPPSSIAEKTTLANCGLGPSSICCDIEASSVHEYLCERYPALSSAGGYELLLFQRGGEDKGFCQVPPPYTPANLKALAGQALVYIRPLQMDLEMKHDAQKKSVETGPMIKCLLCQEEIHMHEFRQHQEQKHGKSLKREAPKTLDSYVESPGTPKRPIVIDSQPGLSETSNTAEPCPSSSTLLTDIEQLEQLQEMFPDCSTSELQIALTVHGTVATTALALTGSMLTVSGNTDHDYEDDDDDDAELDKPVFLPKESVPTLQSLLSKLSKKMSNEKEKLTVDEEDLLNDALAFYKSSEFDPRKRLRIRYVNQPAADTGGVLRQFFTQLLQLITCEFFSGDKYKCPIYNSQVVASGMMKLCGVIIVHSILQGGPGMPIFSPSVYYYLATGNSEDAIQRMTISDCSLRMQSYITKVASAFDVASINQEETVDILSECGLTMSLTNDNKIKVIQSIIVHDSIGKPKIVLDQLREGLGTLGFGEQMKKHPQLFMPLFVVDEDDSLKGSDIINALHFPSMSDEETTTHNYLLSYLQKAENSTLKNFLVFTTGAPSLPDFGLGSIHVKFDKVPSIFASTCLKQITLPCNFPDEATFSSAMDAVVNIVSQAFNCV